MVRPVIARDRLLTSAGELFYAQGITATGVDQVVAAAGVSKPTLYAHFRSKSDLVAAVLERRHAQRVQNLKAWVEAASDDPRERLLAVFDWLAVFYRTEGVRGCAFLNAAAEVAQPETAAREVAGRAKRWMAQYLAELAAASGLADPVELGAQLLMVIDGASGSMVVNGGLAGQDKVEAAAQVAERARRIATALIEVADRGTR
jgi:AcrR family transcriptional regulator